MAISRPFTTFNFKVNLWLGDDEKQTICNAEFSECDGLEMNQEPKTIREGGNNGRQIHLPGPVSYGQLTLKRGMTEDFGLWNWFEDHHLDKTLRASGQILVISSDHAREDIKFTLSGCLPIKLKAPSLNAKDGAVAVEEIQIAYEMLSVSRP